MKKPKRDLAKSDSRAETITDHTQMAVGSLQTGSAAIAKNDAVLEIQLSPLFAAARVLISGMTALAKVRTDLEAEATALFELMDKPVEDAELYLRDHPPSAGAILFLIKIAQSAITTQKARENALKRTAKNDPAKKFVIAEWAKNKGGCKSKADFARLYARREIGRASCRERV